MDKRVAEALRGMGVDSRLRERRQGEERPRVQPKVAGILEQMGIVYPKSAINEAPTSPLNMPGAAPQVDPNVQTKATPQAPDINTQAKPVAKKPQQEPPKVQLRQDTSAGINTLKDLSDRLTGVTSSMKTADLLIQSLSEEGGEDGGDFASNKETLRAALKPFFQKVESLKTMLEA